MRENEDMMMRGYAPMTGRMEYFENPGYEPEYDCFVLRLKRNNKDHCCGLDGPGIIWMRHTGLKDVTGKPIFEGDIVKYTVLVEDYRGRIHIDKSFKDLAEIVFDDDDGKFILPPRPHRVIGNIHENPELLKVKTKKGCGA